MTPPNTSRRFSRRHAIALGTGGAALAASRLRGGQSEDRPYEARQRFPADYDAQASQRPIAVHAVEHLASTDRGVVMLRRIVRDGIRAVQAGLDPWGTHWPEGKVIPTHAQDLVLRLPPPADLADDRRRLREAGRRAVIG